MQIKFIFLPDTYSIINQLIKLIIRGFIYKLYSYYNLLTYQDI